MNGDIKLKHNKFLFINKNPNENNKFYEFRKKIVISKNINNEDDFINSIIFSNYCSNIKYLNCSYNENIMNDYNLTIENIFDNY